MLPETKWLMDYLDSRAPLQEMTATLTELWLWFHRDHGYDSKNQRIKEWDPAINAFYAIVCQLFAGVLLHPQGMTYQALIGYIAGMVNCEHPLDRAKCAAEVIAIAYQCDLVVISKTSEQTMRVTTEFVLEEEIPAFNRHLPLFAPPEPVKSNPILGCRFKQHAEDVCLDHIDRMQAIPLALDERLLSELPEATDTVWETHEQEEQWEDFRRRSAEAYEIVIQNGNRFHMEHNYDTRGRCYCEGYFINYQGASYKKAIVQLAEKEIVQL